VHALRGVFYPSNFTYPLTARFLLQRPELDTGDMPLLYSMLYGVTDQWRKERAWIVRFMSDGMVGRREWNILRKRHVWDLLASIFHSEDSDLYLRRSILEVCFVQSHLGWLMNKRSVAPCKLDMRAACRFISSLRRGTFDLG
jgi:nucleolar pre-ribosomal-associated protein 1